jgi:hypothetical protein
MLEGLGTMFERRKDGVAPFHKSVRDWLADDRSAGSDFVIDADAGSNRLIDGLWPTFESWIRQPGVGRVDSYCLDELTSQITRVQCVQATRDRFIEHLSDREFIHGLIWVGTDGDEDWRRWRRYWYRGYVQTIAAAWPKECDATSLWRLVDALTAIAWHSAATNWDPHAITIWDDIGRPTDLPGLNEALIRYKEWLEGILFLGTAVDFAREVASARPELVPKLPDVLDERPFDFLNTQAQGFVTEIVTGTAGRDYESERRMSFLGGAARVAFEKFKDDSRLVSWSKKWATCSFY